MMDALISGKLHGQAQQRSSKTTGKSFVTATVRAADGNGESLFVNVVAFSDSVCAALLALDGGDSVALSGSITPKVWTSRDGEARPALDMVAQQVLTAYHVTRKRRAMDGKPGQSQQTDGPPWDVPGDGEAMDF